MNEAFEKVIAAFEKITVDQAQAMIEAGDPCVIFIGKSSCPFCRRFAPKLEEARQQLGVPIAFLNSEEDATVRGFRDDHHIQTVPGLLVAQSGSVRVVCDSSLTVEEIIAFITR